MEADRLTGDKCLEASGIATHSPSTPTLPTISHGCQHGDCHEQGRSRRRRSTPCSSLWLDHPQAQHGQDPQAGPRSRKGEEEARPDACRDRDQRGTQGYKGSYEKALQVVSKEAARLDALFLGHSPGYFLQLLLQTGKKKLDSREITA